VTVDAAYLAVSAVIDHDDPRIREVAAAHRVRHPPDEAYARSVFDYVRDEIRHSIDAEDRRVTLAASQVLAEGVGFCYAKAHLLVALLRAEGVPAGLCYQRLADGDGFVMHGLAAVYLRGAWHRQDPRGNKPGIDAQFSLGDEKLAWTADPGVGELDYPQVFDEPASVVVRALAEADDALRLAAGGLPDRL